MGSDRDETGEAMKLPPDHGQRVELNDEVHARPPVAIATPSRISYLALFADWTLGDRDLEPVTDLAERYGVAPPNPGANHFSADMGEFRVRWERHTEFTRYMFVAPGTDDGPFGNPANVLVPEDWVATLPGRVMVASHAAVVAGTPDSPDHEALSRDLFAGNPLVGSAVSGGAGRAYTDFRIHGDRFSRFLIEDLSMTPVQCGRVVQRLFEIDTYRIMALLALPMARQLGPTISEYEGELAGITNAMSVQRDADESVLLDRLTQLEAAIASRRSETHYRFSAAAAYYELVRRRIAELREQRIRGLQTFDEFTERRLAPAMGTCRAVAERQRALSDRVARTTQLLSTRVDMSLERQNKELLESMNRRAELQLRLQRTVEGLSVAAITYYGVGLVSYAADGLQAVGFPADTELITALSIPVVGLLVWQAVGRVRRLVSRE